MIFERMENDLGGWDIIWERMEYDLGGDGKLSSKGREVIFDGGGIWFGKGWEIIFEGMGNNFQGNGKRSFRE